MIPAWGSAASLSHRADSPQCRRRTRESRERARGVRRSCRDPHLWRKVEPSLPEAAPRFILASARGDWIWVRFWHKGRDCAGLRAEHVDQGCARA